MTPDTLKMTALASLFAAVFASTTVGQNPPVDISPPSALAKAPVLARRVVDLGDHTVTFVRVVPPVLPKVPPPPPPQPMSEADRARLEELESKTHAVLNITAAVYVNGSQVVTELRWRNEETGNLEYVAYSNADFRLLTQLPHLETETTVYAWFPFVSAYDLSDWPADETVPIPEGLNLSTTEVEYLVDERVTQNADHELTLAGLDYLHAYYQLHYTELKTAYEQRMAAEAERQRQLRENPPKPENVVIRFWKMSATNGQ